MAAYVQVTRGRARVDKDAGKKIKRLPEYQKFKALTLALLTVSESDLKNTENGSAESHKSSVKDD